MFDLDVKEIARYSVRASCRATSHYVFSFQSFCLLVPNMICPLFPSTISLYPYRIYQASQNTIRGRQESCGKGMAWPHADVLWTCNCVVRLPCPYLAQHLPYSMFNYPINKILFHTQCEALNHQENLFEIWLTSGS